MQITLLWDTHLFVCVPVCDCVHVFVLILDILCQFNKTLNNPCLKPHFMLRARRWEFHHVRTHLATKCKISTWLIIHCYTFDYLLILHLSLVDYSSPAHNLCLCLEIHCFLCFTFVSEVGGISEETAACDWWSLGAILFELLTGMVSQKKKKKFFVSGCLCLSTLSRSLCQCQVMCWFCVCASLCLWVAGVRCPWCVCVVWGPSWLLSLTLVLGECQGCLCDFLPQSELHLLGQGVSSPWAYLLAPGAALGFEHADPRSARKVKTRLALEVLELGWSRNRAVWGTILRQAWEEGKSLFVWKSTNTFAHAHANYNSALLKDRYTQSSIYLTPSAGAEHPFNLCIVS